MFQVTNNGHTCGTHAQMIHGTEYAHACMYKLNRKNHNDGNNLMFVNIIQARTQGGSTEPPFFVALN